MKTIRLLFCFSIFIFGSSFSFAQYWMWGNQGVLFGSGQSYATSNVATDAGGNAFLTGNYGYVTGDTIVFGSHSLINLGNFPNLYMVKYNSLGAVLWAEQFGSAFTGTNLITTDESNNILLSGNFNGGNVIFGSYNLRGSYGWGRFFLTKFDNNGNVLWALSDSSIGYHSYSFGLATDKSKNIFLTGDFDSTMVLGNLTLKAPPVTCNIFTAKFDSNGNILWAQQGKPIGNHYTNATLTQSNAITTDASGNSIVYGSFADSIYFGANMLTSHGDTGYGGNVFIAKYDPNGNLLWTTQSQSNSSFDGGYASSVTTDNEGNIYIDGRLNGELYFGGHMLSGSESYFLVKYSSNGNVIWAQSIGGDGELRTDECDNIYLAGAAGIIKFDTSGNTICSSPFNHTGFALLAVYKTGQYVYGSGTLLIGQPTPCQTGPYVNDTFYLGTDTLTATVNGDPFVIRWQNCSTCNGTEGVNEISAKGEAFTVFPNPNNGVFTIHSTDVNGKASIEVYNVLGEKVYYATLKQVLGDNIIDISNQPAGLYFYRVLKDNSVLKTGKLVLQ